MESSRFVALLYTFFLGILIALFIGVGINTFYEPPPAPEYPIELNTYGKELTESQAVRQRLFEEQERAYQKTMKPYNRNVSIITIVCAVVLLLVGLLYEKKMKVITDGVLLGGLFTLFYGLGRGFASEDSKYVFAVASLSLITVVYLGYRRFSRRTSTQEQ